MQQNDCEDEDEDEEEGENGPPKKKPG